MPRVRPGVDRCVCSIAHWLNCMTSCVGTPLLWATCTDATLRRGFSCMQSKRCGDTLFCPGEIVLTQRCNLVQVLSASVDRRCVRTDIMFTETGVYDWPNPSPVSFPPCFPFFSPSFLCFSGVLLFFSPAVFFFRPQKETGLRVYGSGCYRFIRLWLATTLLNVDYCTFVS